MRMLIALLATALTLTFVELGLGATEVQAASSYCTHRYHLCLARCPGPTQRCLRRCQSQFRHCTYRSPYMGDLL
jgi:hypothetical protein